MYKGKILKGELKTEPSEIAEITWCNLDNVPSPLAPDTEAAIEDFAKEQKGIVRTVQRTIKTPRWENKSSKNHC